MAKRKDWKPTKVETPKVPHVKKPKKPQIYDPLDREFQPRKQSGIVSSAFTLTPEERYRRRVESLAKARAAITPEQRSAAAKKAAATRAAKMTPEEKAAQAQRLREAQSKMTPEQRSAAAKKAAATRAAKMTPEEKAAQAQRLREAQKKMTPEQRSAAAKKAAATRAANRAKSEEKAKAQEAKNKGEKKHEFVLPTAEHIVLGNFADALANISDEFGFIQALYAKIEQYDRDADSDVPWIKERVHDKCAELFDLINDFFFNSTNKSLFAAYLEEYADRVFDAIETILFWSDQNEVENAMDKFKMLLQDAASKAEFKTLEQYNTVEGMKELEELTEDNYEEY